MPYLMVPSVDQAVELTCKGCGADILVTIEWVEVGFDTKLQTPLCEPRFLSFACDTKMEYGCMCSANSAHMQPSALLEQVQDSWQSDNERREEERWER